MNTKKINRIILVLGLVVLLFSATILVSAQIGQGIYLPFVNKSEPTATPTATISPAATPTATSQPTPGPTQPPGGVFVLDNSTSYVDSIDYLHIVGEIVNNTNDDLEFVRVRANLFDQSNTLVDTEFTYTYVDSLPSGERTCFEITFLGNPAGWTRYEFEAPTYWTTGSPFPPLTLLNDSGSYDPTFGWYEVIGQVRNDAAVTIEFVQPVGTLYNNQGDVIGCDFTYVDGTDMLPGQTSAFELTFLGRDYADAVSYRIQIDGTQ